MMSEYVRVTAPSEPEVGLQVGWFRWTTGAVCAFIGSFGDHWRPRRGRWRPAFAGQRLCRRRRAPLVRLEELDIVVRRWVPRVDGEPLAA